MNWSLHKMKHPARACGADYVCSPRLAFRHSTYPQSTYLVSSLMMKISPSPCNVRLLSMTIHHLLPQMTFILRGCLVAIGDYCITWRAFLANWTLMLAVKSNCYTRVVTTLPLPSCG